MNEKTALRIELKARLRALSSSRREEGSLALVNLPLEGYANILSFASLPLEISTHFLNVKLLNEGRLLLPKIEGDHLGIYKVNSLDELQQGPFGILEPLPTQPALPSLILVPGLGFDDFFHRLGYGKGFYDRLLAQFPSIPHWGIGFREQRVPFLPFEPHDKQLTAYLV